jgi:hypothetical protein
VVDIKQSDFNKELDGYLAERRDIDGTPRRSLFSIFKRTSKPVEEKIPEEVIEEMEELEEEIKELDEEMEDDFDYQKREGLLTRFFNLLRRNKITEEELIEAGLDEDVKEVLKISFMWLNKLPAQHMREFKSSGDFETCKEVLIKHGLAKEKE